MVSLKGIFRRKATPDKNRLESEKQGESSSSRLKDLCHGDEDLFKVMENFLMFEPQSQISLLGGAESLIQKGNIAMEQGNKFEARVLYETAAKIEIFRANKENARKYLLLAETATEKERDKKYHAILLQNLDRVLEISRAYYGREPIPAEQTRPTTEKTILVRATN